MFCSKCGKKVGDDWEFCKSCGTKAPPKIEGKISKNEDGKSTSEKMTRPSRLANQIIPPKQIPSKVIAEQKKADTSGESESFLEKDIADPPKSLQKEKMNSLSCKVKTSHRSKYLLILATMLIFIILLFYIKQNVQSSKGNKYLNSKINYKEDVRLPYRELAPEFQKQLHITNADYAKKYTSAQNQIHKSELHNELLKKRQEYLQGNNYQATNWVGVIEKIATANGGDHAFVTISCTMNNITVKFTSVTMDLLQLLFSSPVIEKGSKVYKQISYLKEGSIVMFSGQFYKESFNDNISQHLALTESMSVNDPFFVFNFSDIRSISNDPSNLVRVITVDTVGGKLLQIYDARTIYFKGSIIYTGSGDYLHIYKLNNVDGKDIMLIGDSSGGVSVSFAKHYIILAISPDGEIRSSNTIDATKYNIVNYIEGKTKVNGGNIEMYFDVNSDTEIMMSYKYKINKISNISKIKSTIKLNEEAKKIIYNMYLSCKEDECRNHTDKRYFPTTLAAGNMYWRDYAEYKNDSRVNIKVFNDICRKLCFEKKEMSFEQFSNSVFQ